MRNTKAKNEYFTRKIRAVTFAVCLGVLLCLWNVGSAIEGPVEDGIVDADPAAIFKLEDGAAIIPTVKTEIYVRSGPGFSYPVVRTVPQCTGFRVVEKGIWYRVEYAENRTGYVFGASFNAAEAHEVDRLAGAVIGLDPDGQVPLDNSLEAVAPGDSAMSAKMSERYVGANTGTPDYQINMAVVHILKRVLELEGAQVILSKDNAESNMSNVVRATALEEAGCDLILRMSCNGSANPDERSVVVDIASEANAETAVFANDIMRCVSRYTGIPTYGVRAMMHNTFLNWCQTPAVSVEMGYLSNSADERILASPEYQTAIAAAIRDAVVNLLYAVDS